MLKKSEAKQLVYKTTINSLRKHAPKARELFKGNYSETDLKKIQKEMEELALFLEKRGKIDSDQTNAGGESGPEEVEVSSVRKPKA